MKKLNSNENLKNIQGRNYLKLNPIISKKGILKRNKENLKLDTEDNIEKFLLQFTKKNINKLPPKDFNQYTENLEKSMNKYQIIHSYHSK